MEKTNQKLLEKINFLLGKGQTITQNYLGERYERYAPSILFSEFNSACLSFISNVIGAESVYYQQFKAEVRGSNYYYIESAIGILNAIKTEIESGWLISFKKLVEADVFCDFLEMAEYLMEENYKDPAAVMIGSVLEEHLRSLCVEKSIPIYDEGKEKQVPKKASRLNDDLAKNGVYNKLTQKTVTSWLDLRNNAAHGKYEEYNINQVKLMYQGVFQFLSK
ncbi:hypothetical protein U3A58_10235 [Algoriphagus sp. C2-6-M1]|uniref:hypothetical protein n=1 Tax=Algoriphagus persicinus TaxID=3108754 RepID=UPI002B365C6A|nr:hypothetical protein [Algoriphagus sp. C2-6-M1]MEB2780771.1 hypothetical protein [Algoriphagus sp. C2-6-M1]